MIYDASTGRLRQLRIRVERRTALLPVLRRLRADVTAIRQTGLHTYENSSLEKDIEEYLSLCVILAKLARRNLLAYPLVIEKTESPDFTIDEAGHRYGLEATKATPEAYQRWARDSPNDDEAFFLHPLPEYRSPSSHPEERSSSRLIQAAILRKSLLLPLYARNSGTKSQQLMVRLQQGRVSETEALLKVLWREGLIEGMHGFERVMVLANSAEFILLDPHIGGIQRL